MTIHYDDFAKLELRVANVEAAERVQGSEKLLKLQLDLGEFGKRQIVAGIGRAYAPEQLVGTQIVIVFNLEPRTLMGIESQGMLLAAVPGEGSRGGTSTGIASGQDGASLLRPERPVPPGSKIN